MVIVLLLQIEIECYNRRVAKRGMRKSRGMASGIARRVSSYSSSRFRPAETFLGDAWNEN